MSVDLSSLTALEIEKLSAELEAELSRVDHGRAARNILIDPTTGGQVEMSPMHYEWHDMCDQNQYMQIIAHRDAGKTEQMVVARAVSELGRNRNLRIKIVCESDDLAKARVQAIADHITKNERVTAIFPDLKPANKSDWSKHKLICERDFISKDGSIEAYGILSAGVGGRADLIIFDDVCGFVNSLARPAMRRMVADAINEQWLPMLGPTGRAIYIATPWHKSDATHILEANPEWKTKKYPVVNFKSPWMARPPGFFQGRLRQMGARAYARAYELKALSDEEAVFTEKLFQNAYDYTLKLGTQFPAEWPRVAGLDLAASLGYLGKWTVMFTAVWTPDGQRIPIEIKRIKQTFDDTVQMVVDSWARHQHSLIMVENNSFQEALVTHLQKTHPYIPVEGFTTGANKHHLALGLPGFQVQLREGQWVIPKGDCPRNDTFHQCIIEQWEGEALGYPVGETSDVLMAWWLAENATRRLTILLMDYINAIKPKVELRKLNPGVIPDEFEVDDFEEEDLAMFGVDPDQPPNWLRSGSL